MLVSFTVGVYAILERMVEPLLVHTMEFSDDFCRPRCLATLTTFHKTFNVYASTE